MSGVTRRQAFLNLRFADVFESHLVECASFWSKNLPEADSPQQAASLAAASVASDAFQLLALRYTAGEPIRSLREELTDVIVAHEKWRDAKSIVEADPDEPALYFAEIAQYERCVQLIGLCYLLHRRDLLPRIAALQDAIYSGTDTLYEDLLAWELGGDTTLMPGTTTSHTAI